jgi:hypothetical protein
MIFQSLINRGMDRVLGDTRKQGAIPLDIGRRYIIFSDHHKGARTGADDFRNNEVTYLSALNFYLQAGYVLVILGDAEELWEEPIEDVLASYPQVFGSEARFHPGRYIRVFGNHDSNWASEGQVKKHLDPIFPEIKVTEGLLFHYDGQGDPESAGDLLLLHGHQGTIDSEFIAPISRVLVRAFWRTFQILTGKGSTSPATDDCLRGQHDTAMYSWASRQDKLLLVAGHTHRPVWSSRTYLQMLETELTAVQQEVGPAAALGGEVKEEVVEDLQTSITKEAEQFPPCQDTIKTQPCYFNTGCCSFSDGDITGLELENGRLRLIKWSRKTLSRVVLQDEELAHFFRQL